MLDEFLTGGGALNKVRSLILFLNIHGIKRPVVVLMMQWLLHTAVSKKAVLQKSQTLNSKRTRCDG